MSNRGKKTMLVLGALLVVSANCVFVLSAVASYLRYSARHEYIDAQFIVTDAGVRKYQTPFLYGDVNGNQEVYIALETPTMSAPEYLSHHPVGTKIAVKYHPQMPQMWIQGQSLRVLDQHWDFEDDLATLKFYIYFIAGPSLLMVAAMVFFRVKKKRVTIVQTSLKR